MLESWVAMLIAHLTDLHLGSGPVSDGNAGRLRRVLAEVARAAPDLIVVSGDLAEAGEPAAYGELARALAPFSGRIALTIGNHDRRDAFRSVFDSAGSGGFVGAAVDHGPLRVVTADTVDEGWMTAAFCAKRAAWLDATLATAPDRPTLLVLHHPPVRTGVDWIDAKSDGRWSRRLGDVLARHPQVIGVLAGHAHQPVAATFAGRPLIIAPSVARAVVHDLRPIDPNVPDGRALIAASAPGYALHRWTGTSLVSWFGRVDDAPVVLRFDDAHRAVVAAGFAEARTRDQ